MRISDWSSDVCSSDLLESNLPDDPYFAADLARYFPTPLRQPYDAQINRHRLKREIIVTVVSNGLINRVGINFVHEVREKTGMPPEEVVKAYVIAREISGMRELWAEIEALDNKVPAQLQARMQIGRAHV